MDTPLILVTNDDGIRAEGIQALAEALAPLGAVYVCAPDREQSAVGHGVTLHTPLRVTSLRDRWYMVDGTPTDCVMLAVRELLPRRPDLIVSGINLGANLGDDVTYSGTVAGAFEGMLLGHAAIAISNVSYAPKHMKAVAEVGVRMAQYVLAHGLPENTLLNVNAPDLPYEALQGIEVTRQGKRRYQDEIIRRHDPRGGVYYWIGGAAPAHEVASGTDFEAIEQNKVSVTPLHRDLTNHAVLDQFEETALVL